MPKRDPISVRLSDDERQALDSAAAEAGMSLSSAARRAIREWLRRRGLLRKGAQDE